MSGNRDAGRPRTFRLHGMADRVSADIELLLTARLPLYFSRLGGRIHCLSR